MVALAGEMLNATGWVVIETVADAETDGALTLVAVTVAVPPAGTDAGAV
jgi:hypothetical protein